ncbi:MAG: NIPSNAP family protein [Chitinophagaceae bacterium]
MKRRSFLQSAFASASLAGLMPLLGRAAEKEATKKSKREFYELRTYTLKNKEQEALVESFYEKAAIPALNDFGCKTVGVFKEMKPEGQTKIYVVIPFKSMEDFGKVEEKLSNDEQFLKEGEDYLNPPLGTQAYERLETSLHKSFKALPQMILPEPDRHSRIFELTNYNSANEMAARKKVEMFNEAGEINIYKRVGINPVFFGETIIGADRPSMTCMVTYDNMSARERAWKYFNKDAEWKTLRAMAEYADDKIVSKTSSIFLVSAACSQM